MPIRPPKGSRPYRGTTVSVDRSKEQISKLLRDYGADGVQWAEHFQSGTLQLQFAVAREGGGAIRFRITPAAFKEKHVSWDPIKGRNVTVEAPDWPRSMRLLLAWLKTKLESIAFGLTAIEEEFLAQTVVRDGTGQETTVGELIVPAIEAGGGQLPLLTGPGEHRDAIDTGVESR
jgi:hypothetical protein